MREKSNKLIKLFFYHITFCLFAVLSEILFYKCRSIPAQMMSDTMSYKVRHPVLNCKSINYEMYALSYSLTKLYNVYNLFNKLFIK